MKHAIRIFFIALFCTHLSGEEPVYFDPLQVAKEETAAWKDYYSNDVPGMVQHISHLVIVQFRLNELTAWTSVIPELIAAATLFKQVPHTAPNDEYEKAVLPHLVTAYESIRSSLNGNWDPHQAAKNELDWWIFRRDKNLSNPEIVGKKIADLYSLIYGPNDDHHFIRAGYLRAVASRYRDLSQDQWNRMNDQDWTIIEHILSHSYDEMLEGIKSNNK